MPRNKDGHFYYEWYPTIYQADTQHLSLAEDAAYRRLIDHYMLTKAPLRNDDQALARIIGIGITEWEPIKDKIITYFKPTGLFLHHKFCDEIIRKHSARLKKSKNNGSKGGRPSKGKITETTHQVIESKPSGNPITEQNRTEEKKVSKYRFAGEIIKLSEEDYETFKKNFHAVPDFDAELRSADTQYAKDPPGSWFIALGNRLNARHQGLLAKKPPAKPDPNFRAGAMTL